MSDDSRRDGKLHEWLQAIEYRFAPPVTGLCQCGCGAATKLADRRDVRRMGYVLGQPLPYIKGHTMSIDDAELERRFWAKVVVSATGCWEWAGEIDKKGYGRFKTPERKMMAHVYAYQKCVGLIPQGLEPDHLCRNRRCLLHTHLEPVTRRENLIRGFSPVGVNYRKTHCAQGHKLGEPVQGTRRRCQTCINQLQRERRWNAGAKPTRRRYV